MGLIQYLAIQIKASGVLSDSNSLGDIFPQASVVSVEWIPVNRVSVSSSLSPYPPQEAVVSNEVAPQSPFLQTGQALNPSS